MTSSSALADAAAPCLLGGAPGRGTLPPAHLRILIADDYPVAVTMLQRMLRRLGLSADVVTDGQQAVHALASAAYDLVLLDLSMPVLSGLDVVRWMRDNPRRWADPTVAIISASAFDERPVLNTLGVTHLLPKPFRIAQLTALLEGICPHGLEGPAAT